MGGEVPLAEAVGGLVDHWSVVEGQLRVRLAGTSEDRALRCVCGRCHWIIETKVDGGRASLAVRCHTCGTRGELRLAASPIPE